LAGETQFVFPADPLDARRIDEYFIPQRDGLRGAGFQSSLVSDAALENPRALAGISPGAVVIYRGWMVDQRQYGNLVECIRLSGATPLISLETYLLCHHLPNWYPLLRDLTPETVVYPETVDIHAELVKLDWPAFFLKDYVKSLKTSTGSLITDPATAPRVIDEMRRFRGAIEGGICVRRVESYVPGSETRFFVLRGKAHSPGDLEPPAIVGEVARRIQSPFFSVDVAVTESGHNRVVEIGDGQVSDLVGWPLDRFVSLWPRESV
jgi:ATP-grasp domain-containing protein